MPDRKVFQRGRTLIFEWIRQWIWNSLYSFLFRYLGFSFHISRTRWVSFFLCIWWLRALQSNLWWIQKRFGFELEILVWQEEQTCLWKSWLLFNRKVEYHIAFHIVWCQVPIDRLDYRRFLLLLFPERNISSLSFDFKQYRSGHQGLYWLQNLLTLRSLSWKGC